MANTDVVEKQPLTEDYLKKMDAYWRATNPPWSSTALPY